MLWICWYCSFLRCSGPNDPHLPFQILAGSCGKFAPFEIKENMVLAPLCRIALYPDFLEQLDRLLRAQNSEVSFLRDLKCRKPRKTGPTFVNSSTDTVNRLVCLWAFLHLFLWWTGEWFQGNCHLILWIVERCTFSFCLIVFSEGKYVMIRISFIL